MPAGFALDIPMVISGSNEARAMAVDTHDAGIADEPECLVVLPDAIADVIGDAGAGVSRAELQGRSLLLKHVDKLWVYTADGRLARHSAEASSEMSLGNLAAGVYVVRMQYGNVVRSQQIRVE